MKEKMTEAVFGFIRDYWQEYGYAPTLDEIAEGVGLSGRSGVAYHLNRLQRQGRIWRSYGKIRSVTIIDHSKRKPRK